MHRFWKEIIEPCFIAANIKNVVEVGCDLGLNTTNLLQYCEQHDGFLDIVDPAPRIDVEETFKDKEKYFCYHKDISLNVLWKLHNYHAVLIDGDHNWYTVYHELEMIRKNADHFPLVFFHDIGWPYDRRDLYYNLKTIPDKYVHPHENMGIDIDTNALTPNNGFNARFTHSIYYNNQQCGVLTAVEDFLKLHNDEYEYCELPLFNGLGILFSKDFGLGMDFKNYIKQFAISKSIKQIMKKTDKYYAKSEVRYWAEHAKRIATEEKLKNVEESYKELKTDSQDRMQSIQKQYDEVIAQKQKQLQQLQQINVQEKETALKRIEELTKNCEQLESKASAYRQEADTHFHSIRYRAGTALFEATVSVRSFIKLPLTLAKLFAEAKSGKSEMLPKENKAHITDTEKQIFQEIIYPKAKFDKSQIIEINSKLLSEHNFENFHPLVSIIICNHNGLENLCRLFTSFENCRFYNNFEIIVVDNASTDKSVDFLRSQAKYKVKIIQNKENESFSRANNQGVAIAEGSYLLFLNNDIEVTDGWLDEMLEVAQNDSQAGAIGAKLVYPEIAEGYLNSRKSYLIQHRGISFQDDEFAGETFIRPYNMCNGCQVFSGKDESTQRIAAVTAACLLVKKSAFLEIGGYDEHYNYGYEDVDLCLKLHRKGYHNYICPTALLFHYEFGTQHKNDNKTVVSRRKNNIKYFSIKWNDYLKKHIFIDKVLGELIFSENPLTVAFVVTEAYEGATAGDYFTALEFAQALQKKNYRTKFLCRRGSGNWYEVGKDVDILISMLDSYDLSKIQNARADLVTIAWARNWFDRWCSNPSIEKFTYLFASSSKACEQIKKTIGKDVRLFPIATNFERFQKVCNEPSNTLDHEKYASDYVFTGSYWNDYREIYDVIHPSDLPYRFSVYGKNWESMPAFAPYTKGFINYEKIPYVYKYTKIVIDDANRVTKEWGAVNSRVFDAIAAGCLVLTNGVLGSEDTFHGMLPTYTNREDFENKLTHYMENESIRQQTIQQLQEFVFKNHTYDVRASALQDILLENWKEEKKSIAIMTPVPRWSEAESWGDYHFAVALKKYFEREDYSVVIRILPEWEEPFDGRYVLVLRGISKYTPKMHHINLMWNISHPNDIEVAEYNSYDVVFVASEIWANYLMQQLVVPVFTLLQCTDTEIFTDKMVPGVHHQLLFVGNSRKVYRKIIKDLLPTSYDLAVYGTNWKGIIDDKYIKGENIPNAQLGQAYAECDILLNDHWNDMREKGFISNRIFDGLSVGAFILSDEVEGLDHVLKNCLVTYKDRNDLHQKIEYFISNPEQRKRIAKQGQNVVRESHTFAHRVKQIIQCIEQVDINNETS